MTNKELRDKLAEYPDDMVIYIDMEEAPYIAEAVGIYKDGTHKLVIADDVYPDYPNTQLPVQKIYDLEGLTN